MLASCLVAVRGPPVSGQEPACPNPCRSARKSVAGRDRRCLQRSRPGPAKKDLNNIPTKMTAAGQRRWLRSYANLALRASSRNGMERPTEFSSALTIPPLFNSILIGCSPVRAWPESEIPGQISPLSANLIRKPASAVVHNEHLFEIAPNGGRQTCLIGSAAYVGGILHYVEAVS